MIDKDPCIEKKSSFIPCSQVAALPFVGGVGVIAGIYSLACVYLSTPMSYFIYTRPLLSLALY